VSIWAAFLWGAFAAGSLLLGQALAGPMERKRRLTGLLMGFGAGALLSAVAYELIPESNLGHGLGIGLGVVLGAVTYFVLDRILDSSGAGTRQSIGAEKESGSGMAMFLGALVDGVPESFILGTTLALGGSVNLAFLTAVFVSNIPEGVAGTINLKAAGSTERHILRMWAALAITSGLAAALGYLLAHATHVQGLYAEAFAAGGVLTMLSDSMLPEAFEHGGKPVGLLVVLGYLVAAALSFAQ